MYKIIGADGNEYGPVTLEQLRQWLTENRVNTQTKVLPDGATDWIPLGSLPEFATAPAVPVSDDYRIVIGDCISRGWQLVKANLGVLVGGSALLFIVHTAIQVPGGFGRGLLQASGRSHPALMIAGVILAVIGTVTGAILTGPLMAGLYWPHLKLLRGERAEIGDFFAGFRRGFVNLMLCQLVTSLLVAACIVPPAVLLGFGAAIYSSQHTTLGLVLLIVGGIATAVALGFAIYLSVGWFFALPLAIDRQLGFWEAMKLSKRKVSQHWGQVFGLMIVAGLVGGLGILACCVGALFTMPVTFASFMVAYQIIFDRPAGTA